ncbi:hypothetical protein BB559_006747 [Furculomyces boomerangus]|uniref:Metallo-beta-lactamase domain-containing protein n=1 Tax=Furculomyces boomerangus TaxID=61424 RepID=A0A2T9Y0S3_9FUNG|nr:hypothetical protein BB559_006747 [Furculomyces boomerangus]
MENTKESDQEHVPRDIKLMNILLQSQGIEDCEQNVLNQLLEFANKYTIDVLQDALIYSEHAGKKEIDLDDVRLSIQGRVNYSFTNPPEREFYMDLAESCNKVPLPLIPEKYGVRLPPEKHTLTGINFQIVPDMRDMYGNAKVTEVVFLGTGTSGCIPSIPCLVGVAPDCKVCSSSMTKEGRKNRRRNTSIIAKICEGESVYKSVLIDCGKTFYESAVELFPKNNIKSIDAVLLTHGHADAILGLDDLRQWTNYQRNGIDVYMNNETFKVVSQTFPYIVDTSKATGGGEVPKLNFKIFDNDETLNIFGIDFIPLEVEHGIQGPGQTYLSLGFKFSGISYISDVSFIPKKTGREIANSDILVIDSLMWIPHLSHYSYFQALEAIEMYKPKLGILTDFCHRIDHFDMIKDLENWQQEKRLKVEPSFDGMVLEITSDDDIIIH